MQLEQAVSENRMGRQINERGIIFVPIPDKHKDHQRYNGGEAHRQADMDHLRKMPGAVDTRGVEKISRYGLDDRSQDKVIPSRKREFHYADPEKRIVQPQPAHHSDFGRQRAEDRNEHDQ